MKHISIPITFFILISSFLIAPHGATAQPGAIDLTFNTLDNGTYGEGPSGHVYTCILQPDGKVIIGGVFNFYNGTASAHLARLNADGSIDTGFTPGTGATNYINTCALQPDGKIIMGGSFSTYFETARLNADGSLDPTFNPWTFNSIVETSALQPDGKIIVGGDMGKGIARLNADGSLDAGFDSGSGANDCVRTCVLQPDGKIIIGGDFTSYNGTARNHIARLNADGSLDMGFGSGVSFTILTCALQPDGKVIVGGYDGGLFRLNADGSWDAGFDPGSGVGGGGTSVNDCILQPDGKIIIGGEFTSYNGTARNRIARLNADGSLDTGFDPGSGAGFSGTSSLGTSPEIHTCVLQPDGKIIIGGDFTSYNGYARKHITRLNANGSIDVSFNPSRGTDGFVHTSALQPDGKIIIGGGFTSYNDIGSKNIARLNSDGSLDTGFDPGLGANGYISPGETCDFIRTCALQPDGKIIIGGCFTTYNGIARKNIARLNTDGSLDMSFDPGLGANSVVRTCAIQPDGKIIIGGQFWTYNGTARSHIARLNADGSLDMGFDFLNDFQFVNTCILQPDGKIIVGTSYYGIVRLNADGSSDPWFNPGSGPNGSVKTCILQPDGKIIIGGSFTNYNGPASRRIARLNTDGSLDAGFTPATGASDFVIASTLQPDGKIIIVGDFNFYMNVPRDRIARLNVDGSLDTGFDPGLGASGSLQGATSPNSDHIGTCTLQPDGKIIIGGGFTNYDSNIRQHIARIHGGSPSGLTQFNDEATNISAFDHADNITVNINSVENGIWTVSVIDLSGRSVIHKSSISVTTGPVTFSSAGLSPGLYLIDVEKDDKHYVTKVLH